ATWKTLPVTIGWAGAPPKPLLDAEAVATLDVASRAWAIPPCSAARFAIAPSGAALADPLAANGRNDVIVHLSDWPSPLATGAAAHTVIFVAGDSITEADIHLNARDFTFDDKGVDLRSILTHELGHVLGIGHSADPRATMSAGLPAGLAGRSLEKDDTDAVCALYPSTDTTAHGCEAGCPAGWACIGFTCERGEPGTTGAACADTPRRCEGSGDTARCIGTSEGDRCAPLCATVPCGSGLKCADFEDDRRCIHQGASIPVADAGPLSDAGADTGTTPPAPPSSSSGCTAGRSNGTNLFFAIALLISIARRRLSERL
ncbi:MAG: matrixin family metalloprotease, partial [Polyangiales bacterium]